MRFQKRIACWVSGSRPWLCADTAAPTVPRGETDDGVPLHLTLGLGALAEAVVVPERAVIPVPAGLPPERASLLGCAVLTGVGAVRNTARVAPGESVAVVGLGDNSLIDLDPERPAIQNLVGGFVLVVGSLDVRKNQRVIYQAYQIALSQGHTLPTLVLVGPHGRMWQEVVHLIQRDVRLRDRVIVATDVGDRELAWLYRHCSYTIYPSLCEGWGLPIGESLAFGKVCLSSNRAAMPEVGGSFAHRFDPHNPLELRNLIVRLTDPGYLGTEQARIRANFVPRTWTDVVETIRAAIAVRSTGVARD